MGLFLCGVGFVGWLLSFYFFVCDLYGFIGGCFFFFGFLVSVLIIVVFWVFFGCGLWGYSVVFCVFIGSCIGWCVVCWVCWFAFVCCGLCVLCFGGCGFF